MEKFQLISRILGYVTKPDPTNIIPEVLVSGSQNVLINDGEKVETRKGYTVFPSGDSSTATTQIESAYDWETSSGDVIHLRGYDDELEFYAGTVGGVEFDSWKRLKDGWTAVDFCFAVWWDTTEGVDGLLFVNGADKIYSWSGAMASLASATANTITKNGTTTWAQERFLTGGGKMGATTKVNINGTEYTYTGGETTTTLTGVTPDPSGEAADSLVFQVITEHDNEPADATTNDVIKTLNNQLWVGSNANREVFVSKNTDFKDFTYSSPRVPGEGALLVLDNIVRAFATAEERMYISSGRDDWYRSLFQQLEIASVLTETLDIKKLKTSKEMGAQSQDLVAEVGNEIAFIAFDNQLRLLGRMEEVEEPQFKIISDQIKPDFDNEDFTNGHLKPHKNRIYISAPTNDKVYINELRQDLDGSIRRFWQPPQILPVQKFMLRSGDIYGHSNGAPLTYKLFNGTNDNANSFKAVARTPYLSYGTRRNLKVFDEYFIEGYISANTKLAIKVRYDFSGATQILEAEIDGSDNTILFEEAGTGALGEEPLGGAPLGDQPEESEQQPKFKVIKEFTQQDFFEVQFEFSTDTVDAQWEILSQGINIRASLNEPISIKQQ